MNIWTIYDHPSDHPEAYVARLFKITAAGAEATDNTIVSYSLERIRTEMRNRGFTRILRRDDDDPVIMECWL